MLDANRDNEISYSEFHDFLYGKSDGNDDDDDDDNDNDGDSDDERSSKTNNSESLSGKLTDSILKAVQKYAKKKRKNVRELLKGVLKRYEGGSLQGVISPSDFKDALETVGCGKIVTETQSDALASFFDVDGDNMVDCASFVAFMCLQHIDAAAGATK